MNNSEFELNADVPLQLIHDVAQEEKQLESHNDQDP